MTNDHALLIEHLYAIRSINKDEDTVPRPCLLCCSSVHISCIEHNIIFDIVNSI